MAVTLEDFLRRRSDLMLFGEEGARALADEAARLMGRVLGWSRQETSRQLVAYREAVARMMAFRSQAETSAGEAGE
jgi:glycerol-3-phosphate dehydrogenase